MEEIRKKCKGAVLVFCLMLLSWAFVTMVQGTENAYGVDIEMGKKVYESRCGICHGPKGDGKGLIGIVHRVQQKGMVWKIYPRDFTTGVFRFRSTSTGYLPTDEDLLRVITNGIPRAYMPSMTDIPLEERKAAAEYIKTFSKRWKEEKQGKAIPVKKPKWIGSTESIEKGKKLYKDMKCWECHGEGGKGDGPKSDILKDDWGDPVLAFDFTTGAMKMGFAPEDIYKAYTTGLDGTGMPSYEDSLKEEERWHLVSYTLKLMGRIK